MSEPGMLGRPYRRLTLGIVSVVFLIAFEATAVGTATRAASPITRPPSKGIRTPASPGSAGRGWA